MNDGDTFQSSDLGVSSERMEHWRALGGQLQPSRGAGSGPSSSTDTQSDAQWLRKLDFSVYGSGSGGQGLDLSALRVNFNIKHAQAGSPAILWARVYNLAPETMAKVIQFKRLQVKAGYRFAGFGMIFDGTVVQYRRGKENPTDTYLEIHAADGDDRINRRTFIGQYPAGTKDKQTIEDAAKQLGMTIGYINPEIGTANSQRDTTYAGSARAHLREMMNKYDAKFFIEQGKLIMMKNGEARPGAAVVLTPKTGLVGLPEVTPQGIQAQCLLNPNIKIGGVVEIDQSVLSGVPYTPGSHADPSKFSGNAAGGARRPVAMWGQQLETAFTSPTGRYKVILLEHTGDTRGLPWYCNMICVALDDQGRVLAGGNPSTVFSRAAPEVASGSKTATPPDYNPAPKRVA